MLLIKSDYTDNTYELQLPKCNVIFNYPSFQYYTTNKKMKRNLNNPRNKSTKRLFYNYSFP